MTAEASRAINVLARSGQGRLLLLRALRLLGAPSPEEASVAKPPALYSLARILEAEENNEDSVVLIKRQLGNLTFYDAVSGQTRIARARERGKARIGATVTGTVHCDPAPLRILGFSLWRDGQLAIVSLDPELRNVLLALGVSSS